MTRTRSRSGFAARFQRRLRGQHLVHHRRGPAVPVEPTPIPSTAGALEHFYMVYMENRATNIVGSPNAPFLNSLINAYGFADNFYA